MYVAALWMKLTTVHLPPGYGRHRVGTETNWAADVFPGGKDAWRGAEK